MLMTPLFWLDNGSMNQIGVCDNRKSYITTINFIMVVPFKIRLENDRSHDFNKGEHDAGHDRART